MRTYRIPLPEPDPAAVRTTGMGGHLEDHNETDNQLRSLWLETEALHRQLDRLRWHLISVTGIVIILAVLLAVTLLT